MTGTDTFKTPMKKPPNVAKGKRAIVKKATALQTLKVEYVKVTDIQPNSYNPNRQSDHDFALLQKSMSEDGFTQPIVVHRVTKTIVDGEHRWRCAQSLGYAEVPVVFVDMTPEQMRISTLRHNRARGSEDVELTALVLRDLRELGALDWAQDSLMMDDAELETLLQDISAPDALAAEEFGEAWAPDTDHGDSEGEAADHQDGMLKGSTPDAIQKVRDNEKKIASAKTEEEKSQAKRDLQIYRVGLVFAAEEADIVKQVLGEAPAVKLLAMCRAELAASSQPAVKTRARKLRPTRVRNLPSQARGHMGGRTASVSVRRLDYG